MTELVICSGKGGTGKTSVTAALAALAEEPVLADCDVDAANLHLVLDPEIERSEPFTAGNQAVIRAADCAGCGECAEYCRFGAIERSEGGEGPVFRVDPLACEGCGVCVRFCPAGAIDFPTRTCGSVSLSRTRFGPLVHAALDVGAENSGKLVSEVRRRARELAERTGRRLVLVDGPPGIGCPVTAALTGADLVLLVTEPSLSGLHDLLRVLDLADHFEVPALVCINRCDLSPPLAERIESECAARGVAVIGRIPYDPLVNAAQAAGRSLVEHAPEAEASRILRMIWSRVARSLPA